MILFPLTRISTTFRFIAEPKRNRPDAVLLKNCQALFVALKIAKASEMAILPFKATLLVPLCNVPLEEDKDNDKRQNSDSRTHEELVQIKHLGIEEV